MNLLKEITESQKRREKALKVLEATVVYLEQLKRDSGQ